MPVHKWLLRTVYFPAIGAGLGRCAPGWASAGPPPALARCGTAPHERARPRHWCSCCPAPPSEQPAAGPALPPLSAARCPHPAFFPGAAAWPPGLAGRRRAAAEPPPPPCHPATLPPRRHPPLPCPTRAGSGP
jgi:hypothetical protein